MSFPKLQYKKNTYLYIFNNGEYSTEATSVSKAISQLAFTKFGKTNMLRDARDAFKSYLSLDSRWFVSNGELCDNAHNRAIMNECWESNDIA